MSDKLAVIQAQKTIEELKSIEVEGRKVVAMFKDMVRENDKVNRSFNIGKMREYTTAMRELNRATTQYTNVERQLSEITQRTARLEIQQARLKTEQARSRRELARAATEESRAKKEATNASLAEARAERAQQRQTEANTSAYKKLAAETNKVKLQAKDLEAEMLMLTRDFKMGLISQEQYTQQLAKLQGQFSIVSARAKEMDRDLKRINANVGDRQMNVGNYQQAAMSSVARLDSQIKNMVAMYAGFQVVMATAGKMLHSNYELSDVLVDLQIRLHGNKEAADELVNSLKKLDTRTSLGELVNTAAIVAKKGVAQEEIEGITKALDDYFIVAGKEAGNREEGTASIIKLISIFNEDKHVTAERVTEIGTALVKLQNSGVATGSRMIDIAERIGAVRGITGVTLPQVLGFAAAIEQLGQKSEVAGTAGMQILTKVLSDMPQYAKMADVSVKELRKAYTDNPFEAVVMVAKGVLKTGDLERMTKDLEEVGVRGSRVKGVLGDIASNADFVRKRIKDAGLAINESGYMAETAALKQDTYAATIDRIGKEFELVGNSKGFVNFLKTASSLILGFIKLLTAIPFGIVITGITLATAAWAYYKGMMIQTAVATAWNNQESLLGAIRMKAARLGLLGEAEAMRVHTLATNADTASRAMNIATLEAQIVQERYALAAIQQQIVWTEAEIVAKEQQIAARTAHIAALEAEIVATREATVATTGLNTATKMSPLGIVLGVIALAIPLLMTLGEKTEKTSVKIRTLADNQKDLNDAMDKGVKNAAEEVSELDLLYKTATDANKPLKERKEAVDKLQDQYPSYFKNIKTEIFLTGKAADSYIELREAIVSAARADAIKDKLKGRMSERLTRDEQLNRNIQKEEELNKKLNADAKARKTVRKRVDGGDGKSFTVTLESTDLLKASNQRLINVKKTAENNKKADDEEDRILLDMLEKEDKKTKKLRDDRVNRLGKFASNNEEKEKEKGNKEGKYTGSKFTGEQKDQLMKYEALKDKELAINEKKYYDSLISEKEYLQGVLKINIGFFETKIKYLKGNNAKETLEQAKAELEKTKLIKETRKRIFEIESKELEENFKKTANIIERQSKEIDQNEYLTAVERLQQQIKTDSDLISQQNSYYQKQIDLAVNAGQDILEWERKRDEEIGKIEDQRMQRIRSLPEAFAADLETQSAITQFKVASNAEDQRALILADKKLSADKRAFKLSQLEKDLQVEKNKEEIKRLELLKAQIYAQVAIRAAKGQGSGITPEEEKALREYEATIKNLNNSNTEIGQEKKQEKIDQAKEDWKAVTDSGLQTLKDLGFDNLANSIGGRFDELFKQIVDGSLSAKDATLLAASAIADGLSSMITSQKNHTIAALDEQLKYSQEAADQETEFINGRLEQLNAIEDLTVEQIIERQKLEDEARGVREQQQQREKMIETQKAKAEQKAASQQALINGALAATMTLAQMGFIAGAIPAALALAFGIAQSVAIMSKDPTPKYWKGRQSGPAEFAWTQEKGAEVITDKNDNIKSLGSNSGAKMTYLEAGDKVYTAEESKSIMRSLGPNARIGHKVLRKAINNSFMAPVVNVAVNNNSKQDEKKIEAALRKAMKDFATTSIRKENGVIIKEKPGRVPQAVGTYDLKTGEEKWV